MKVYAYIRKSTDDAKLQKNSLAYQKEEILRRFGGDYENIEWLEASESAAKDGRTVFAELIAKTKKQMRKSDNSVVLLAYSIDRLSRNNKDTAEIADLIGEGVKIYTVNEGEASELLFSILGAFARREVQNTKKRMKSAYRQGAKEGKYFFGVARGYMAGSVKGIREPHPIKSKGIKKLFDEFLRFDGGVTEYLMKANEIAGIFELGRISLSGLSDILRNKFYIGIISYEDEEYKGAHKPIIDKKVFDAVQKKLEKKGNYKTQKHNFLYSRKIKCTCGRSLIGEKQKGNIYYRCHNKECEVKTIKQDTIDHFVGDFFEKNKLTDRGVRFYFDNLRKVKNIKLNSNQSNRTVINNKINKVDDRISELTDMRLDRKISDDFFEANLKKLELEKESLKREYSEVSDDLLKTFFQSLEKFLELLESKFASWEKAGDEKKALILKILGSNFFIKPKKQVEMRIFDFLKEYFEAKMQDGIPDRAILEKYEVNIYLFSDLVKMAYTKLNLEF